jgi:hypothetical protein
VFGGTGTESNEQFISLGTTVKTDRMGCDAAEGKGARKYLMVAADQSTPCRKKTKRKQ